MELRQTARDDTEVFVHRLSEKQVIDVEIWL